MPVWAFLPIILLALVACPLSMWVMGKVLRRKMSCAMCAVGTQDKHEHAPVELEARKAAVEREIAQLKTEIEQNASTRRVTAKSS